MHLLVLLQIRLDTEQARKILSTLKRRFEEDKYIAVVISAFLIYSIYWSNLVILRLLSLNAYVLDLGVFYGSLWQIIFQDSPTVFISYLAASGIRIVLSPLALFHSYRILLIFQTVSLASSVFPLYWFGKMTLKSKLPSLFISISFLVSFQLAAVNWFDVHAQAFFIPLFMWGYFFLIRKNFKTSLLLIFLSGLVRFPYMIFPFFLGLALSLESFRELKTVKIWKNRKAKYSLILMVISLVSLLFSFYVLRYSDIMQVAAITSAGIPGVASYSNIDVRVFTILLVLSPVLFLPILLKKWSLLILPFIFVVLTSLNDYFYFPIIMFHQYFSGIIPFLFMGSLEAMAYLTGDDNKSDESHPKNKDIIICSRKKTQLKIAVSILAISFMMATVYQPYGPLNKYTPASFHVGLETDVNTTLYNNYMEMVNLIPANDPYVLFQDDMPQVMLHDPYAYYFPYTITGFPSNLTFYTGQTWTKQVDYVIANPYGAFFFLYSAGTNINMYQALQALYSSGNFGVIAELNGLILLKNGYNAPPIYYLPEDKYFNVGDLSVLQSSFKGSNAITGSNLSGNQTLWFGPYAFLQPGNYTITLQVKATNISTTNNFVLRISDLAEGKIFNLYTINGSAFNARDQYVNLTFPFSLNNFYENMEFVGQDFNWNGSFSIRGMSVKQVSPP